MSRLTSRFATFIAELQRRHVFRVIVPYVIVAIATLELAEIIQGAFGLADWWLRLAVVVAALGVPVTAALAWVYEVTPQGLRTMRELDEAAGRRPTAEDAVPRLALLGVTLVAAVGAGYWWLHAGPPAGQPAGATPDSPPAAAPAFLPASGDAGTPIRSLAVLPLESFSAEEGQDYFANGMHEALVSQLSQLGSVRVISRTSTMSYDRTGKSMAQIAQDLGVEGVVEGSVLLDGDQVRITVQLIHAPSDTHLWAQDYEREMEDIIGLQREVAQAITNEILGEIDARADVDRIATSDEAPPADPEAAMWDMRGRWALSQESEEAAQEAQQHFQEALREDSTYAPALVGMAGSTLWLETGDDGPSPEALARAQEYVTRAVRIAPDLAEVAELQVLVDGFRRQLGFTETVGGDIEVEVRGLGADSTSAAYAFLVDSAGVIPAVTDLGGRLTARLAHLRAREHQAPSRVGAARSLVAVGRFQEAEDLLLETVEEFPESDEAWDALEHVYVIQGHLDEVPELRRRREAARPDESGVRASASDLETSVQDRGLQGYWATRLEELERARSEGREVSSVLLAQAHAALGDADTALEHLQEALQERDPALGSLRSDPVWDPYRSDPRFQSVMRDVFRLRGSPAPGRGRGSPGGRR